MPRYEVLERITAHHCSSDRRKQWVEVAGRSLEHPASKHADRLPRQWCAPLLATLAEAADVRTGTEDDILTSQAGHLRGSKSGLYRNEEHRVVSSTDPRFRIRRCEQCVDLRRRQGVDDRALDTLCRNRQHALNAAALGRRRERRVLKERVDRRQSRIARASGIAALALQMIENPVTARSPTIIVTVDRQNGEIVRNEGAASMSCCTSSSARRTGLRRPAFAGMIEVGGTCVLGSRCFQYPANPRTMLS